METHEFINGTIVELEAAQWEPERIKAILSEILDRCYETGKIDDKNEYDEYRRQIESYKSGFNPLLI